MTTGDGRKRAASGFARNLPLIENKHY